MFTGIISASTPVISMSPPSGEHGMALLKVRAVDNIEAQRPFQPELNRRARAFGLSFNKSRNAPLPPPYTEAHTAKMNPPDQLGDSIAINGCCLTLLSQHSKTWAFEVSKETLAITNLSSLLPGDIVNIERAMNAHTRFGGHVVLGHVDCVAEVLEVLKDPGGWVVTLKIPEPFDHYCAAKGSLAVQGVSLTINQIEPRKDHLVLSLCLIPTTLEITNLKLLKPKMKVNIEVDHMAKQVERFVSTFLSRSKT